MPHAEEGPTSCVIDEDGNVIYPTSPAETLASEAMGMPAKGGSPWTNPPPGSSSTVKPQQNRRRQRTQMPKQSYIDLTHNSGFSDDDDDQGPDLQLNQFAVSLLPAPFDDVDKPDAFSPANDFDQEGDNLDESFPMPPRSGQNAFLSTMEDEEDQDSLYDTDKSRTPNPGRLTSSHQRKMSDASDMPAPSKAERMASSSQLGLIDTTVGGPSKKKGILQFSSAAPSVAESIDEEPLQSMAPNIRDKAGISSQKATRVKTVVCPRKSVPKSNDKVKLSALDLEDEEMVDAHNDDPFDQANIPLSRNASPGPSNSSPIKYPQKQPIAKGTSLKTSPPTKRPSPRDRTAVPKSPKPSPQQKQPARPRQKAKPSAAAVSQLPDAPECDLNNGNNEDLPDGPLRPVSNVLQANAASTKVPAQTRAAKATREQFPAQQKEVVYISSATDSESLNMDDSDSDEYVDKSDTKIVQGINPPPNTRNTTSKSKGRAENHPMPKSPGATSKSNKEHNGLEDEENNEDKLASKSFPKKSARAVVAQDSTPKLEIPVRSRPKKSTDPMVEIPLSNNTTAAQQRRSANKQQRIPGKKRERLAVSKPATRHQARQTQTTYQSTTVSRDPNDDQKDSGMAYNTPYQLQGHQTRATRRSRADQPQKDRGSSKSKSALAEKRAEHTRTLKNSSLDEAHGEIEERTADDKRKDGKSRTTAFETKRPENNENSKKNPSAAGHQSESKGPGISIDSKSPTLSNGCLQKEDHGEIQSAGSCAARVALRSQTQQLSFQVKNRAHELASAEELPASAGKNHLNDSRTSQNRTPMVARKPSTILEEEEEDSVSAPRRGPHGKQPTKMDMSTGVDISRDGKDVNADDKTDSHFGEDPVDRPVRLLIPDSQEQSDDIEDSAFVYQLRDSAMSSNAIGQGLGSGGNSRKRPRPEDECANQTASPTNEKFNFQSPVNNGASAFCQQPGKYTSIDNHPHQAILYQQAVTDPEYATKQPAFDGVGHPSNSDQYRILSQQSDMEQQPEITKNHRTIDQNSLLNQQPVRTKKLSGERLIALMNQPTWEQDSTMSQQPLMVKEPFGNDQKEIIRMPRDSRQGATDHHLPTIRNFSQPGTGRDSAKTHLQGLSKNFQRPSKRPRLQISGPDSVLPMSTSYNQLCVPATGLSTDDVFAPTNCTTKTDVDQGVVRQLRGIGSMEHITASEAETQSQTDGHCEMGQERPRQHLDTRVLANASHSHSMRNVSQGTNIDESPDDTRGSGLWRRDVVNRQTQGALPFAKNKEKIGAESHESQECVEEVMHRIVAGVLRVLQSRESEVHQVIDNYKTGGGRIVQSIAATHATERKQLIEEHEHRRLEYIRVCEDANRRIESVGAGLRSIDIGKIAARKTKDTTFDRLKRL